MDDDFTNMVQSHLRQPSPQPQEASTTIGNTDAEPSVSVSPHVAASEPSPVTSPIDSSSSGELPIGTSGEIPAVAAATAASSTTSSIAGSLAGNVDVAALGAEVMRDPSALLSEARSNPWGFLRFLNNGSASDGGAVLGSRGSDSGRSGLRSFNNPTDDSGANTANMRNSGSTAAPRVTDNSPGMSVARRLFEQQARVLINQAVAAIDRELHNLEQNEDLVKIVEYLSLFQETILNEDFEKVAAKIFYEVTLSFLYSPQRVVSDFTNAYGPVRKENAYDIPAFGLQILGEMRQRVSDHDSTLNQSEVNIQGNVKKQFRRVLDAFINIFPVAGVSSMYPENVVADNRFSRHGMYERTALPKQLPILPMRVPEVVIGLTTDKVMVSRLFADDLTHKKKGRFMTLEKFCKKTSMLESNVDSNSIRALSQYQHDSRANFYAPDLPYINSYSNTMIRKAALRSILLHAMYHWAFDGKLHLDLHLGNVLIDVHNFELVQLDFGQVMNLHPRNILKDLLNPRSLYELNPVSNARENLIDDLYTLGLGLERVQSLRTGASGSASLDISALASDPGNSKHMNAVLEFARTHSLVMMVRATGILWGILFLLFIEMLHI